MKKVCSLVALAVALALAAASTAAQQAGTGEKPTQLLTLNIAVLPFFSTAHPENDAGPNDLDGYRAVAMANVHGRGPAAVVAEQITASHKAVGLVPTGTPREMAPLQLQGVFLALEHRPDPGAATGWVAYVEIGAEVRDTGTGAQLLNQFYHATAPARGPLPAGVRSEIFRRGITAYDNTPLGHAFKSAVKQMLWGVADATPLTSLGDGDPDTAVIPLCEQSTWEGRVIGREGKAYRIDAGRANGLQEGVVLSPYSQKVLPAEPGSAPTPVREPLAGLLRVAELNEHSSLLVADASSPIPTGQQDAVALVHYAQVTVDHKGFDIADAPSAFMNRLKLKIIGFENRSQGVWPRDSIFVKEDEVRSQGHSLTLTFLNAYSRKQIAEWTGVVFEKNAANAAEECFTSVRPALMAAAGTAPVAEDAVKLPDKPLAPQSFVDRLAEHLKTFARNAENAWPPNTLQVEISPGENQEITVLVRDGRKDRTKPERIKDAEWKGAVTEATGAAMADTCFGTLKPALLDVSHNLPVNAVDGISLTAHAEARAGDPVNVFQNRRQDFHLYLGINPEVPVRKDGTYRFQDAQHPPNFVLRADADVWVMLYYVDRNRDVGPAWKYNKATKAYEAVRLTANVDTVIDRLKVTPGDTGLEYMVAVAWTDQKRAVNLAMNHPGSIGEFAEQVRTLALAKNPAPDVDLKGFVVDTDAVIAEPEAAAPREVLTGFQQAAGRFANQENGKYAIAWLQYRTAGK